MHALRYYYEFTKNKPMANKTTEIRARFLERKAFKLKDLVGVKPSAISKLALHGIRDADQMVEAGRTESDRRRLQEETGLSLDTILELVKMSDLTRIFGLKGIRARLYHDSGVDTIDKMATIDPDELIRVTSIFVHRSGFKGIPPTPKEAQFTVRAAKDLPRLVQY
jgi:predicted flap endonuclease-1-like 5' DNA nuclease